MSIKYTTTGIKIQSKIIHPLKTMGAYAGILVLILLIIFGLKGSLSQGMLWKVIKGITGILAVACYLLYWLICKTKDSIFINNENVEFHTASMPDSEGDFSTNLKSLSHIHLANDGCFLLYNNDGNQDYVFDTSYFTRDDIQIALNFFGKKVKITIDDGIANNEKFIVKKQESLSTRKRFVASTNNSVSNKQRIIPNKTLEIENNTNPKLSKEIKRKLEL